MLGVFAYPIEGTNIIRFMSVDDIIKKKEQAYNWTRRVIASYMANKPKRNEIHYRWLCTKKYT